MQMLVLKSIVILTTEKNTAVHKFFHFLFKSG